MSDTTILRVFPLLVLAAYLLGSIPFGLLIGRLRGLDVRRHGSGNIGSTNVGRVLGRQWGYLCFLLDVAKGLLPVLYAGHYLRANVAPNGVATLADADQWIWLAVGTATIVGHMFSIYLRFHGGKGVATSLGVVLGIWPYFTLTGLFAFAIWLAVWGLSRYVSLASIVAALSFPVGFLLLIWRIPAWHVEQLEPLLVFSCAMAILVVIRHRANIQRLLRGTEERGGRRRIV